MLGDADGNGIINFLYFIISMRYYVEAPETLPAKDLDGDGTVTEEDKDIGIDYALSGSSTYPIGEMIDNTSSCAEAVNIIITAAQYAYNPSGLRASKTVDGVTTNFVYSGMQIVYEYSTSSSDRYYYGLNRTHNSNGEIYVYNAHGDTVQLVKDNEVVACYTYDAFGNLTSQTGESDNPFLYCSEYFDEETETYYLRARYYNPANGRFTQQDAWAYMDTSDPLSLNLYTYCANNPVLYVDPSGHVVTEWDMEHLSDEELATLQDMTNKWFDATPEEQETYRNRAESIRSKYRMPYEYTDEYGYTRSDTSLLIKFEQESYDMYKPYQPDYSGVLLLGTSISQIDTIAPGPADIVAGAIIVAGTAMVYLAKGKSNPHDLERGMTPYQKGMFQREIEDWKFERGMPPNSNVPWEILCALAELVKDMYKK